MPIYEYECQKCKKVHEVTQKISEKPLKKCPECSGPVKKLISSSGFQLKGGGWYKDGYASSSSSSGGGSSSSSSSGKSEKSSK